MTDREKLIEVLGEFLLWPSKMKNVWMPQGIEKLADHLLSNGVVVREKGEWVETKNGFHCSRCKRKPGQHPTKRGVFLSDLCPNCGADMTGGDRNV